MTVGSRRSSQAVVKTSPHAARSNAGRHRHDRRPRPYYGHTATVAPRAPRPGQAAASDPCRYTDDYDFADILIEALCWLAVWNAARSACNERSCDHLDWIKGTNERFRDYFGRLMDTTPTVLRDVGDEMPPSSGRTVATHLITIVRKLYNDVDARARVEADVARSLDAEGRGPSAEQLRSSIARLAGGGAGNDAWFDTISAGVHKFATVVMCGQDDPSRTRLLAILAKSGVVTGPFHAHREFPSTRELTTQAAQLGAFATQADDEFCDDDLLPP